MAKIGFFHLPWIGHLNPMAGLADELVKRGHQVVFFNLPELEGPTRERGFCFQAYGRKAFHSGSAVDQLQSSGAEDAGGATKAALSVFRSTARVFLEQAEPLIREANLDLWVVDQLEYAAATLARKMGARFVTVAISLVKQNEVGVPGFNGGRYSQDPADLQKEAELAKGLAELVKPLLQDLDDYRTSVGMEPFSYQTIWSELAQISQQPAEFEFPRKELPPHFHFTGPFTNRAPRPQTEYPWERLEKGRSLVYAGFGTMQHQRPRLLETVLAALGELEEQVVLSLSGVELDSSLVPANVIAVPYAPQPELLKHACLAINHAGLNTVLECLAAGVPMVSIPIAHDHPGIASRIEWTGVGIQIKPEEFTSEKVLSAAREVLSEPSYREAAGLFQAILREKDGPSMASDIIERVLRTGQPVLNSEG